MSEYCHLPAPHAEHWGPHREYSAANDRTYRHVIGRQSGTIQDALTQAIIHDLRTIQITFYCGPPKLVECDRSHDLNGHGRHMHAYCSVLPATRCKPANTHSPTHTDRPTINHRTQMDQTLARPPDRPTDRGRTNNNRRMQQRQNAITTRIGAIITVITGPVGRATSCLVEPGDRSTHVHTELIIRSGRVNIDTGTIGDRAAIEPLFVSIQSWWKAHQHEHCALGWPIPPVSICQMSRKPTRSNVPTEQGGRRNPCIITSQELVAGQHKGEHNSVNLNLKTECPNKLNKHTNNKQISVS